MNLMKTSVVVTILADDEPGLVESVSGVVLDLEGSWLESRMCRLAGKFAGILRIEIDTARVEELLTGLETLGAQGITVTVERGEPGVAEESFRAMNIEVVGQDRPGIVHNISEVLAANRINIVSLESETMVAPMSGENLFKARAELLVPAAADLESVQSRLEEIAADLMVELNLSEPEG